jgi:hypothetical protein
MITFIACFAFMQAIRVHGNSALRKGRMQMPRRQTRRRFLSALQPVLTYLANRNARTRELTAAMQMPCTACRQSLRSHIGAGNRWKGCQPIGGAK